ncbi:MAG: hypothetical protein MK105_17815 [Crocinitomicaceae bacterium]|nr:hypothetical protein [Crocinitomicaceae bacterium]
MNGAYNETERYYLEHYSQAPFLVVDSIGTGDTEETFKRDSTYEGMITNYSTDLKFVGTSKDFIKNIKETIGANEEIILRRQVKDVNDVWIDSNSGILNLTTVDEKDGQLSVKISSGGFLPIIKTRDSNKIEIETMTTIDNSSIEPLSTEIITIAGRETFLRTTFEVNEINPVAITTAESNTGATVNKTCGIPVVISGRSHETAQSVIPSSNGSTEVGTSGMMIINKCDRDRTLSVSLETVMSSFFQLYENVQWCNYHICLTVYENGNNYNLKERTILNGFSSGLPSDDVNKLPFGTVASFTKNLSITHSETINLLQGESLSLEAHLAADLEDDNNAGVRVYSTFSKADVSIEENSTLAPTTTKSLSLFDLGNRLVHLITDKENRFKSSVLGKMEHGNIRNGQWSDVYCYSGMWLRNFESNDQLYKKFATSLSDYAKTLKSVFNISLGIETRDYKEYIVAEKSTYFWNPNIGIVLPNQITNAHRKTSKKHIYSAVEIGYEKGGYYEEVMGLDEPNGKINYVTSFTRLKNIYDERSRYRADVYGEEIQRNKQKTTHPTQDASADTDIFIKDMIEDSGILRERVWQDDFQVAPTGIYSPDTVKNLRFSPANNRKRHDWLIATALYSYSNSSFKFGSSTANSSMTTQLIGASPVTENANLLNSDLGNPLFSINTIEFEHAIDESLLQKIKGCTDFNGQEIPNFYCKVQFTNENGQTEYGYIESVEPSGVGKWKLILASNLTVTQ